MSPGDVVELNSGGPKMTVIGKSENDPNCLDCYWFDIAKNLKKNTFMRASLKRVDVDCGDFDITLKL